MLTASVLRPLWDRAAEWTCRLAMIEEARSFLYLSTFYVEHDDYGTTLLTALLDAQRRGVSVNLLLDGFGARLGGVLMTGDEKRALSSTLTSLRLAGATVTVYQPEYSLQRLGGGQHVKIQVSEQGEAIFGSSNITKSSFEGWNEYSVALRGRVVRRLLESYRTIGGSVDDRHLESLDSVVTQPPGRISLDYWMCNPNALQGRLGPFGWRGPNIVTDRMIAMIESAHTTIELTSFFFKPVPSLMNAVLDAARRGVRVAIYHSARQALPATDMAWIASAVGYRQLLTAGVEIYENIHGEHSKIVLIDRSRVAFGSYNFEDAAHDRLAEAMLATADDEGVAPAVAIFEELCADPDNTRVTSAGLPALPRRLKMKQALCGQFKRWM